MSQPSLSSTAAPTRVRFFVLAWLCLFATLAYVNRSCLNVPIKDVEKDLNLTRNQSGMILSSFFLGYACFQIPAGWLGARWGSHWAITFYVMLWSAATAWMGLAGTLTGMIIGWFVAGVAQAGIFPCSVNTISKWFPPTGRAFPSGMLASFMSVGGIISAVLTAYLLKYLQWSEICIYLAIPGLTLVAGFAVWFRDRPSEHASVNAAERALIEPTASAGKSSSESPLAIFSALGIVFSNRRTWLICSQQIFRAAGYAFFLSWFPVFLQEARGVPKRESGYLTALPILGVVIGSALGGWVMDRIYRRTQSRKLSRKGMAVGCTLFCGVMVVIAYFSTNAYVTTALLTLGAFCAGACGPAGYVITIDLSGRHVTTLFSTMNMMGNFGAFFITRYVPKLQVARGWSSVLLLVAAMYVLASCSWALLNVDGGMFPEEDQNADESATSA